MKTTIKHLSFSLLAVLLLAGCSSSDIIVMKYLPVQFEEGEKWSIIDDEGKVVAKKVFSPDAYITPVWDKSFWVYSIEQEDAVEVTRDVAIENAFEYEEDEMKNRIEWREWKSSIYNSNKDEKRKYSLHSIDRPKKPLTKVRYKGVTEVFDDRALAVQSNNQPIVILDGKGRKVATMAEDIISAGQQCRSFFWFWRKDGTLGWTDRDGKVIKDGLFSIDAMGEDAVVARENAGTKFVVFDEKGKKTGSFVADHIAEWSAVASNRIFAIKNGSLYMFDYSGKEVAKLHYAFSSGFSSCYFLHNNIMSGGGQAQFFSCNSDYAACHAYDSEEPKSVLINVDGEEVLSTNYDAIYPIGGDMFIAIDGGSYGIIHASGDVVLKCNYDDIFGRLGSKVVVKEDDYWHVVDEDGKTYGDEFKNELECVWNGVGRRTEFTEMADFINELVWKNFYSPGGGFSNPSEVAEYIDYGEPSSYMYENDMKAFIDHVVVGGFQTIVTYDFGGKTLVDKTYGDDLLDRHRYQHPHYNWSSDTFLQSIHGEIRLGSSRSYNDVVKYLKAELRCSHFTQEEDGNLYKSIGQGKKLRMSFEKKNGNLTFMMEAITTE